MLLKLALSTAVLSGAPGYAGTPVGKPVTLGEGATALQGTLLGPMGRQGGPAMLIIAGSGPTDRDGNSPLGVKAQPYKLLAEGLAGRGVTTLRFDKRGVAASAGAASREEDLRFETYIEDAKAWTNRLRRETKERCVWLLGHSEGALVAQAAARDNQGVCGLVLVAGAGKKAGETIREQLSEALPDAAKARAFAALAELEAGRTVAVPPPPAALFRPSVQPYLISWFRYDPADLLRSYKKPVLLLRGTTDLQATIGHSDRLAAAQPRARRVELEGVNHVLKIAPAQRAANLATYGNAELPLAPGIVDVVANFITRTMRTRSLR